MATPQYRSPSRLNTSLRLNPLASAIGRALFAFGAAAAFAPAHALPSGAQVVSGQIGITRTDAARLDITQSSQRAIVNWQGFGIAAGEAVRLAQPAQGVALFRVIGNEPSQIFGSLQASGALYLVNPNGVLFGAGAQVDVGALVASTLSIGDADFTAGRARFAGDSRASVVNQGSIRAASGGYAVLLGASVDNSGSISAPLGTVALGAASAATLDVYGNGLLTLTLNSATDGARVSHSGSLAADGGRITLAALGTAARPAAINVSGLLQAQSLQERNGEILLLASGPGASLSFSEGASANANAQGERGSGGKVTLWSDDATNFAGRISARGGVAGGDGGSVEVSGANTLAVSGRVDLSAPNGSFGTLLLDPGSITIHGGAVNDSGPNSFTDRYLVEQLALANVSLSTSNANNDGPQDITIASSTSIVWGQRTTLTLNAGRSLTVGSGALIQNTEAGSTAFDAIVLRANAGGSSTAGASVGLQVAEGARLEAARGNISVAGTGGTGAALNDGVRLFAGSVLRTVDGNIAVQGIGGGNGAGSGNRGVVFTGAATVQATGSGAVSISGSGGSSTSDAAGVLFGKGSSTVATGSGALSITGNGGSVTAGQGQGIASTTATTLTSTSGTIGLRGSVATVSEDGIAFLSGANRIGGAASSGNISLSADRLTLATGSAVQTSGQALLQPVTAGRAIDIGGSDSNTALGLAVAELNRVTAARIEIGNAAAGDINLSQSFTPTGTSALSLVTAGAIAESPQAVFTVRALTLNAGSVDLPNANQVDTLGASVRTNLRYNDADALAINEVKALGTVLLTAPNGRITVNGPVVAGAGGDALTIASQSFTNNAGAEGLRAGNGRWRVFSQDPANDVRGTAYDFKRYDCSFGGACAPGIPAAGNGFLYSIAPLLRVTLSGASGNYGDTPVLSASNLVLAGFIDGDTAASIGLTGQALMNTNATARSSVGAYEAGYGGGLSNSLGYAFKEVALGTVRERSFYTVTARPVTLTADAASRVYGDANPTSGTATAGGRGLVNGDTVTGVTLGTAASATSNVGRYDLTASNAVFGSGLASNYVVSYAVREAGLSVTARNLVLTPDAVTRVYGNANPASGSAAANPGGLVNGDAVASVTLASSATASSNVGAYTLSASSAQFASGSAANYQISYAPREAGLSVTARNLVLTPDAVTRVYGNANPTSGTATANAGGLVNGDAVSSVNLASPATVGSNVGSYTLSASGASFASGSALNYTIGYAERAGGLSVTARSLTLTPDAVSRVYGNANPTSGSATANGLVNGDTVASVSLSSVATVASNVGSYDLSASNAVFGSGAASNYTIGYATRSAGLSVTARSLTVTPDAVSRVYGNANATSGSASASGLVNGDAVASVTLSSAATVTSNVGSYDLSASNAVFGSGAASNYAIGYAARSAGLSVTARSLTVTPDAVSRIYGNANATSGSATASGLVNGDTVASVSLSSVATVTSNVGSYDLSASNAVFGSGVASNYAIGYATRSAGLSVTARSLTLTPDAVSRIYGNANASSGSASASGLVNGDAVASVTLSSAATVTSNVGSYDLSASNAVFGSGLASNYAIAYAARSGGLSVTARSLTLTPDAVTRVYGNANATSGSATASGLVNGDTVASVTLSTVAMVTSNVGSYDLSASNAVFGSGAASNYAIGYAARTGGLSVTARSLTLTPDAVSRVYGNANATSGSASASGLVNGDTVASVTLSSAATVTSNVGSYDLSASNAVFGSGAASNYAIAYATRSAGLSVTARSLTLTPNAVSRIYGNANPLAGSASASGLVNGDTVGSVTLASAAGAASNVGSYALGASNAVFTAGTASNYAITYAGTAGGLSITPRAITLTPTALTRAYGDANPGIDTASVSSGNLVNGDTVAQLSVTASTALATSNAGSSHALVGSNAVFGSGLATNYSIGYAPGTLSISTRAIAVAALAGQSKNIGQTDPALAYALRSGTLVNGDSLSGSLARAAGEAPGLYAIGVGTLSAGPNYSLGFSGALFSIGGVPQTAPIDLTPPLGTALANPLQTFLASLDSLAPTAAGPNAAGECVTDQALVNAPDAVERGSAAASAESRLVNRGIRLPVGVVDPCRELPERKQRPAGTAVSSL